MDVELRCGTKGDVVSVVEVKVVVFLLALALLFSQALFWWSGDAVPESGDTGGVESAEDAWVASCARLNLVLPKSLNSGSGEAGLDRLSASF